MMVGPIVREPPAVSRRPYTRWTPERDAELRRLYLDECLSRREIAARLGLGSWKAVRSRIHVLGLRRAWNVGDVVRVAAWTLRVTAVLPDGNHLLVHEPSGRVFICTRGMGLQPVQARQRETVTRYRLRCIGPGPTHYFWSRDRRTHRMCDRCRVRIERMG